MDNNKDFARISIERYDILTKIEEDYIKFVDNKVETNAIFVDREIEKDYEGSVRSWITKYRLSDNADVEQELRDYYETAINNTKERDELRRKLSVSVENSVEYKRRLWWANIKIYGFIIVYIGTVLLGMYNR